MKTNREIIAVLGTKEEYKCIRLQCGGCRPIWSSIYPGNPAVHWVDIQSPASIPAAHSNVVAGCGPGKWFPQVFGICLDRVF